MAKANHSTVELDRPRIEALIENLIALLDAQDAAGDDMEDDIADVDGEEEFAGNIGCGDPDDAEEDDPREDDGDTEHQDEDGDEASDTVPNYPSLPERSQYPGDWRGRLWGRTADVAFNRPRFQPEPTWRSNPKVIEFPGIPVR